MAPWGPGHLPGSTGAPLFPALFPEPPRFIKEPKDQIGVSGGVASFVCQATGDPKPRVTWNKKGKKVNSQRFEVSRGCGEVAWGRSGSVMEVVTEMSPRRNAGSQGRAGGAGHPLQRDPSPTHSHHVAPRLPSKGPARLACSAPLCCVAPSRALPSLSLT